MLERLKQHILNNFPFLIESKLLIAISGGIDSVVLVNLLSKLNFQIALAHVNFTLRAEESDKDEVFVKKIAKGLNIPIFTYRINTATYAKEHKVSTQMAAREIRYKWFEELLEEKKYDYILTAHHLDDTIETFFINLSRSSGLEGLTGIPDRNNRIIRPLLAFSRDEIVSYAKQNNIQWREDASNAKIHYLRNKIRHQLIPVLKEIDPHFIKAINQSQLHLQQNELLVNDYISQIKPKIVKERNNLIYFSLKSLNTQPNSHAILYELLKKYGFTEWNDVYELVEAQTGKKVYSKTHFLLKDRENLVLGVIKDESSKTKDKNRGEKTEKIKIDRDTEEFKIQNSKFKMSKTAYSESLNFQSFETNEVCFDIDKITFPLVVRKWIKGDYFYPLGMQGKMKLSDFFVNEKLSIVEKENIWLLCDAHDQVVWVVGLRLDNRFKITNNTKEYITIKPIKN